MPLRPLRLLLLVAMLTGAWAPAPALRTVQPKAASSGVISPAGLLNPDGTLRLDGQFTGSFNLQGWDVHLDPNRGPVFGPTGGGGDVLPGGQWASLGGGGSGLNGPVNAVAVGGNTVYVGGQFLDTDSRGHAADFLAEWNTQTGRWSAVDPTAIFNGDIYALAISGTLLYVGGSFGPIQGANGPIAGTANLARWNGTSWSAVGGDGAGGSSFGGPVLALAITGTVLYAGGSFTQVKTNNTTLSTAAFVARWNGTTWSALGHGASSSTGSLNNRVNALAVFGSNVYVGGNFTTVNDFGTPLAAADYVAQWNASTGHWSALSHGHFANDGSLNNGVQALAVNSTGTLFVGGTFTDVVDASWGTLSAADYIASWNGTRWQPVGTGAGPNYGSLNAPVDALVVSGTTVYAGGVFFDVHNGGLPVPAAKNVAAATLNGGQYTWAGLGSNGAGDSALPTTVLALARDSGGHLFVGGNSRYANDNGNMQGNASYLAEWTGTNWAALTDQINGAVDGRVFAVAVSGGDVYVGGDFVDVHDGPNILMDGAYVARWDGLHWRALGGDGYGYSAVKGPVMALAVTGTQVYVGGMFNWVEDNKSFVGTAAHVAVWDGTYWHGLGSDGVGGGSINANVLALALSGTDVYVGGTFINVKDGFAALPQADYVARWDGLHWHALGSNGAGDGALNGLVSALAITGTAVYAGGGFVDAAGLQAADWVVKWDTQANTWSALGHGAGGNGALNGPVEALAVGGNSVYAGGVFFGVNDQGTPLSGAQFVARWDSTTGHWQALGTGTPLNHPVSALAVAGGALYVGGAFTDVSDSGTAVPAADYVARWDGHHWSALGSGDAGQGALSHYVFDYNQVYALAVHEQNLYAGGVFYDVSNQGTVLPAADGVAGFGLSSVVYLPLVHR